MNINHFNSLLDGGAATAARRLHEELLTAGVESRFYYSASQGLRDELDASYVPVHWQGQSVLQNVERYVRFRHDRRGLKKLTRTLPPGAELFTSPNGSPHTSWPPVGHPISSRDDIIQLHWISKFLDYTSFFGSIPTGQPVVWTLHDMNAFTGGCHFSDGCSRYATGCGGCHLLANAHKDSTTVDSSRRFFEIKKAALSGINLHIVAPSRWLLDAARSSELLGGVKSFTHIPYGISTADYYPMSKAEARARLGIDPNATVFCFGAMNVVNRRKGAREMMQALSQIADLQGVEGIVFGGGKLPEVDHPLPKIHQVGPVTGTLAQRAVYSAADAFVLPSLEDNLPLTGLEAMACGTAVVGFDAGGIPDYVDPGQTGLLARTGDANELGIQLRRLMTDRPLAATMGLNAQRRIQAEFSGPREASAYRSLYATLIDGASNDQAACRSRAVA